MMFIRLSFALSLVGLAGCAGMAPPSPPAYAVCSTQPGSWACQIDQYLNVNAE